MRVTRENSLGVLFPDIFEIWDFTRNKMTPYQVGKGSSFKIHLLCDLGHSYSAWAGEIKRGGGGCSYCFKKKVLKGFNDLESLNPDIAKSWDHLINKTTPDVVMQRSNKKYWWICPTGHPYETTPDKRVSGQGCPYCASIRVWEGFNDLASKYPEIALEWSPKNNKSAKEISFASSSKKYWWECSLGHSWDATIHHRTGEKNGCPYCSGRKPIKGETDFATLAPELVCEWSSKNTKEPYEITRFSNIKRIWDCTFCKSEWQATPDNRRTVGCHKCKTNMRAETDLYDYLAENLDMEVHHNIDHKYKIERNDEGRYKTFIPDIVIPSMSLIVEHDGLYWHDVMEDRLKNQAASEAGYDVLRVVQGSKKEIAEYIKLNDWDFLYSGKLNDKKLQNILNKIIQEE